MGKISGGRKIENIGCDPFGSDPCGCGIDFLRVPQQGDVSAGPARAIEVIEPDQLGELDDYETSFLTYYADGTLAFDAENQPVDEDDIPKIIGNEALNRMGEFALSAVHVRNHNYHKDYEILRVRENWPGNHDDEEDE